MFDQYMCYCSNADGTLGKSIRDAESLSQSLLKLVLETVKNREKLRRATRLRRKLP